MRAAINVDVFKAIMRNVPMPVTIVTVAGEHGSRGITIGSFTSASLDPCLISFNIKRTSRIHEMIIDATWFAVHLLSTEHAHLSRHFALSDLTPSEQFSGVAYHAGASGTPILDDAFAVILCRLHSVFEAGDHSIILGEVVEVSGTETYAPMVYLNRAYRRIGEVIEASTPLDSRRRSA